MTSLFDVEVSVGHSIKTNVVETTRLGRERFDKFAVLSDNAAVKDGLYYTPAKMRGTKRGIDLVESIGILALDLDHIEPDDFRLVQFLLSDSGLEHIIHTTVSHTEEKPRYRVILNPSRALTIEEYRCVIPQVAEFIGAPISMDGNGAADKASQRPAQPMFYPMVRESRQGTQMFEYVKGKKIDVDPYVLAMIDADIYETYRSPAADYQPMAVPGAVSEDLWLSCVLNNYTAKMCIGYDNWFNVGQALHHQTDGRAYETWLGWSRLNKDVHALKISEHEMRGKWPSMKDSRNKDSDNRLFTIRSILNSRVKQKQLVPKESTQGQKILALAYRDLLDQLQTVEDFDRVMVDIQDDSFVNDADRRVIATAVVSCMQRLRDSRIAQGDGVMMLRPEYTSGNRREYFYDHYVFSEAESQYYEIKSKSPVSIVSMNYMYGSRMPPNANGERKIVHKVLTNESNGFVKPRVMHGMAYEVNGDAIVYEGTRTYLNQFKPDSWPHIDSPWDEDDALDSQIKGMILNHLGLLCNGDGTLVKMIIQHLGHLRQKPMERIHFAYAISSTFQGAGKSTLRAMYEAVLGTEQVNLLSASNVDEDYNAYAGAPKLMSFIEEFEFETRRDQNRAIKKMKDLITSDTVSVRRMRTDVYESRTYTAYAMFSNDEYVLGHESTGRRWVPIIVEAVNAKQCEERLGENHLEFYNRYHELMKKHPDRFAAFFNDVNLQGFQTERPPETIRKRVYIENVPQARCLRIIQDIIEDNSSVDLTADYACGNSTFKLVSSHLEENSNVDVDELRGFTNRQLRNLVDKALRSGGYQQFGLSNDRVRLPFELVERTRLNDVWVKDKTKYKGDKGIKLLRTAINEDKDKRLKLMTKGSVVNMKGDPYIPTDDELAAL